MFLESIDQCYNDIAGRAYRYGITKENVCLAVAFTALIALTIAIGYFTILLVRSHQARLAAMSPERRATIMLAEAQVRLAQMGARRY